MSGSQAQSRGVLDPVAARARFSLALHEPAAELAGVVDRHWVVRWDLNGRELGGGISTVESFLRRRLQPLEPGARLVQQVIDGMLATPHDTTVAQLAARHGVVPRTLQPLSPLRRRGAEVGAAALPDARGGRAHAVGSRCGSSAPGSRARYADQAHFVNDFHARTGRTPAAYLAACAAA